MYRDITVNEALQMRDAVLVDVRSENEYVEATIPGAVNIPLLDDQEREAVGKVYREVNPRSAREVGLRLISPKLPEKVAAVENVAGGKNVVLFCWRGGQRSQAFASVLDVMGYPVYRIAGGFKSYRQYVNSYLQQERLPLRAVVLHGLTGVGKTEVLERLASEGIPALDLEGMARHRGSVFGKIGLPPSPSQKMFEGLIVEFFRTFERKGIFVVECESRRVGDLIVPRVVMSAMSEGYRILLYTDIARRVERLKKIYTGGPGSNAVELKRAVFSLQKRLGRANVEKLGQLIDDGRFDQAIELILKSYYDPLYRYPGGPSAEYDLSVDTTNLERAAQAVKEFVVNLPEFDPS